MPRNGAPARSGALPGCAGVSPARRRPAQCRRGEAQPRRRRGPGPRASSPHVPAHRGIAGKGAAVTPLPPTIGTVEPRGAPQRPATAPPPAPARFPGARASRPHVAAPHVACRGETQPRQRRGPGPRASSPHVPAHRGVGRRARASRDRKRLDSPEPRGSPQCPARSGALPGCAGVPARTSLPRAMPPGRGATPPKAGPGTAGILPARSRSPRHCREGRSRCAPPANDRNCRAPRSPATAPPPAPARFLGARASSPHVADPRDAAEKSRGHRAPPVGVRGGCDLRARRPRTREAPRAPRRLRPRAACGILTTSVWRPFPPRSAPS